MIKVGGGGGGGLCGLHAHLYGWLPYQNPY